MRTLVALAVGAALIPVFHGAQHQQDAGPLTEAEQAFQDMLENSHWEGHWYRRTDKGLEYGGRDKYRILRAERIAEGHWTIVAEFELHGKVSRFAVPARVTFAGSAAVVYLDGLRLPGEPAFSFRVVFDRDTYSGVFFSEPLSGVVFGTKRK